eukprot:379354-Prymnesium_polylepis.1
MQGVFRVRMSARSERCTVAYGGSRRVAARACAARASPKGHGVIAAIEVQATQRAVQDGAERTRTPMSCTPGPSQPTTGAHRREAPVH